MKILQSLVCFFFSFHLIAQSENNLPQKPFYNFQVTNFNVTGLPKSHLSIFAVFNNVNEFNEDENSITFKINLNGNDNLFDESTEVTGMSGSNLFGTTKLTYDKTHYINYKFGFDQNILKSYQVVDYTASQSYFYIDVTEKDIMMHVNFTIKVLVDKQLVSIKVNLHDPSFLQSLKQYVKLYKDYKIEEKDAQEKEEERRKAEVAKRTDNLIKLSRLSSAWNIRTDDPDWQQRLTKVENFLTYFNQDQGPLPKYDMLSPNSSEFILLKTKYETPLYAGASFDRWASPDQPLIQKGILPAGEFFKFSIDFLQDKKDFVFIALSRNDPWIKLNGGIYTGFVSLSALEYADEKTAQVFKRDFVW